MNDIKNALPLAFLKHINNFYIAMLLTTPVMSDVTLILENSPIPQLQNAEGSSFSKDASQGWIWDQNTFSSTNIYYFTASDPTSPSLLPTSLTNATGFSFSTDASQGWIWDQYTGSPNIYYLTPTNLTSPSSVLLEHLTYADGFSFSTDASQGWIWDQSTFPSAPYIYYLKASNPISSSSFVKLDHLQYADGFSFSTDSSQGWIWDQNPSSTSVIYYLTAAHPTSPSSVPLGNLTNATGFSFSTDASRGWIWDQNPPSTPHIYYLTATNITSPPPSAPLTNLTYANGSRFSTDASQGWIWDTGISSSRHIYYLTAADPESPSSAPLTDLQNAELSSFSTDASQGWIWDFTGSSSEQSDYIYYLKAANPISFSSAQLSNLALNRQNISSFSADASQGWIWNYHTSAPYIYYLTATNPESVSSFTSLSNLQNAFSSSFSTDAKQGWIWDTDISAPYIYYLTPTNLTSPSSVPLGNLTNAESFSFSADASQGWIWDDGISAPYIYYLTAANPTSPSSAQLTNLTNAYSYSFSADASQGWIWDMDVPNPYIYYLKAVSPIHPVAFNWSPGLGGALLNSSVNTILTESKTLRIDLQQKQLENNSQESNVSIAELMTDAQGDVNNIPLDSSVKPAQPLRSSSLNDRTRYSIRLTPFNDFLIQKKQGTIPGFRNEIVGALSTFDAQIGQGVIGGGLAYGFNHVHYLEGLGHANVNQETAVVYGSWQGSRVFMNVTCWGGFYQFHNVRNISNQDIAQSHAKGYLLSPHVELRADFHANRLLVEPFVMFDWANDWQKHFTEHGVVEMNLQVPHQYASLLRSETGICFLETLHKNWGRIVFTEKGSYINQTPFHHSSPSAVFLGSATLFSITTGSLVTENLGSVELLCSFLPNNPKMPFGMIDLQGEWGSSYQSYFAALHLGKKF